MAKSKKVKNQDYNSKRITSGSNDDVMKIIKILVLVLLVFGIIYFITMIITGEIKFGEEDEVVEEVAIQYTEILGGEILNMKEEEYYVILYDYDSDDASLFSTLTYQYSQDENALKIYEVNTKSPLNQRYLDTENSNLYVSHASELKIKDSSLLKISNGRVSDAFEGKDAIKNVLQS